jgi:hypothetical protein
LICVATVGVTAGVIDVVFGSVYIRGILLE